LVFIKTLIYKQRKQKKYECRRQVFAAVPWGMKGQCGMPAERQGRASGSAGRPEHLSATLLWRFRLASLGTQLVMWTTIGLLFGALAERRLASRGSIRSGQGRLIPGSMRRPYPEAPDWAHEFDGRSAAGLLKSAPVIWCASCENTRMCRRT
jgi:hypothetical protein